MSSYGVMNKAEEKLFPHDSADRCRKAASLIGDVGNTVGEDVLSMLNEYDQMRILLIADVLLQQGFCTASMPEIANTISQIIDEYGSYDDAVSVWTEAAARLNVHSMSYQEIDSLIQKDLANFYGDNDQQYKQIDPNAYAEQILYATSVASGTETINIEMRNNPVETEPVLPTENIAVGQSYKTEQGALAVIRSESRTTTLVGALGFGSFTVDKLLPAMMSGNYSVEVDDDFIDADFREVEIEDITESVAALSYIQSRTVDLSVINSVLESYMPVGKKSERVLNALYESLRKLKPQMLKSIVCLLCDTSTSTPYQPGVSVFAQMLTKDKFFSSIGSKILSSGNFSILFDLLVQKVKGWSSFMQLNAFDKTELDDVFYIIVTPDGDSVEPITWIDVWGEYNSLRRDKGFIGYNAKNAYLFSEPMRMRDNLIIRYVACWSQNTGLSKGVCVSGQFNDSPEDEWSTGVIVTRSTEKGVVDWDLSQAVYHNFFEDREDSYFSREWEPSRSYVSLHPQGGITSIKTPIMHSKGEKFGMAVGDVINKVASAPGNVVNAATATKDKVVGAATNIKENISDAYNAAKSTVAGK